LVLAQLDGRVAFISGGARGQGRSHAVALAREGCDIAVFDITSSLPAVPYPLATSDDLAETVKRVEAVGRRCISIVGDVRSSADVDGSAAGASASSVMSAAPPMSTERSPRRSNASAACTSS